MKLKSYFFIMLVGMLWSTGAMAGTVNINSADVAELVDSIHGIGPRLAQAIVNYRSQYAISIQSTTSWALVESA